MTDAKSAPALSGDFDDGLVSLHEQHEATDGSLVLFQCTECGYVSLSLGKLHGHIERHRGYTRFNFQVLFSRTSPASADELMRWTRVLRVDEATQIGLEEVESL